MNKNWLYRVLAMALVAMLALPVFALAEEADAVEVLTELEEAVEEQGAIELGGEGADDAVEVADKAGYNGWYEELSIWGIPSRSIDLNDDFTTNWDDELDMAKREGFQVVMYDPDITSYTVTSSNKKVATCGRDGFVTYQGAGKCKVTLKFKYKSGSRTRTRSIKISFEVTNSKAIKEIRIYWGNGGSDTDFDPTDAEDTTKKSGSSFKTGMGQKVKKVIMPVSIDKDGTYITGEDEDDDYIEDEETANVVLDGQAYKYKWSNKNVAYFNEYDVTLGTTAKRASGVFYTDPLTGNIFDDPSLNDQVQLIPVFYKAGTSTVTFSSLNDPKKKATAKFTVNKLKRTKKYTKKDLSSKCRLKIASWEVKNMNEVEITFAMLNGTDDPIPKKTLSGLQITADGKTWIDYQKNITFPKCPANKVTTFKKTFKNTKSDPAVISGDNMPEDNEATLTIVIAPIDLPYDSTPTSDATEVAVNVALNED